MTNINRENYEVWFIDFIDGNLEGEELKELNTFLQDNPDLEEELNAFEELNLKPSAISYNDPEGLHKSESDLMEIPRPDYLMVKQMEEGLTIEEEKELALIIREDGALIKRGVEFQHSRLKSEAVPYERKSSLLQIRTPLVWLNLGRIAAAGVAAAMLLTFWNTGLFQSTERNELALQPLLSRPALVESPGIPESNLVKVELVDASLNSVSSSSLHGKNSYIVLEKEKPDPAIRFNEEPFERLLPKTIQLQLAGNLPNAYETGLRHMMPMYLDINRNNERLLTSIQSRNARPEEETFFMKGLQFVDRVSGDLVNFDKLYDEDGNFVAYNFKAGYLELERKLRR